MSHYQECAGSFRTTGDLILASASPRRRDLLSALGLKFSVEVSRAEEPPPSSADIPLDYACANARIKASEVAERFPGCAVLGADTIVVLDGEILGKPSNRAHAVEMLSRLSGARHTVITGCCLVCKSFGYETMFHASTHVWIAEQRPEIIRAYVQSEEPLDKAGSYAVQGCGAFMVQRIEGSWTNVVGLPMDMVVPFLIDRNIIAAREN